MSCFLLLGVVIIIVNMVADILFACNQGFLSAKNSQSVCLSACKDNGLIILTASKHDPVSYTMHRYNATSIAH